MARVVRSVAVRSVAATIFFTGLTATAEAGDAYLKVYDRTIVGDSYFSSDGSRLRLGQTYQDHQLTLFGSLDVVDGLRLTVSGVPVGIAAFDGNTQAYFGGLAGGVEVDLWRGPVVLRTGLRLGGRPDIPPLALDGTVLVAPVVGTAFGAAQASLLWPLSFGWLSIEAGVQAHSSSALSTALFAASQFGWRPGAIELSLQLQGWNALSGTGANDGPVNVLGSGNTRYIGFDLDVAWWFGAWGPFLGVGGALYAEHNAATPSLRAGIQFMSSRR